MRNLLSGTVERQKDIEVNIVASFTVAQVDVGTISIVITNQDVFVTFVQNL